MQIHSLESLLLLMKEFQKHDSDTQVFIDRFQELYFNERIFEHIPEQAQEAMDNIVLAVGLTVVDDEERDEFGPAISADRLKNVINENLPLIESELL